MRTAKLAQVLEAAECCLEMTQARNLYPTTAQHINNAARKACARFCEPALVMTIDRLLHDRYSEKYRDRTNRE